MCPDRQILSVYIDGELPSPWKEKMEAHLRSCAVCREQLEGYRRLSRAFGNDAAGIFEPVPGSAGEEARERIWRKLAGPEGERRRAALKFRYRTLAIPLPAAAAAAVVFVLLLTALLFRQTPFTGDRDQEMASSGIGLAVQGIVPASDMNGVLQYLGNQDTADFVTIQLPESKSFMSSGEPTIIRATDYSRRNGSR
ncbi:MAG: zf-HC2 domain-containing protein [Treponema sp.]|nr:zf-HC2 domain-containing protein [Treponema sp.]